MTHPAPCRPPTETHSPSDSLDSDDFLDVARNLLRQGNAVHLHLMQNGVLWMQRRTSSLTRIKAMYAPQFNITCDDVSLDLRGIPRSAAASHVSTIGVDGLIGLMADPSVKTIWHS
jgi:uncharacterized protein YfaQ (DUF2300 family)